MVIGKIIEKVNGDLFNKIDEVIEIDSWRCLNLFTKIPNITKTDILEYFEYHIAIFTSYGSEEVYNAFIVDNPYKLDKLLLDNDSSPTYISEYINIVGQLFLGGYIDFGLCGLQDKEENLLSRQKDKYQAWIHFRDNFFYTNAYNRDITEVREKYPNMSDDEYIYSNWDTPQYWDMYTFWVARTPKGTQYFDEILAPRFYNKYKDLEVEIDDKGNVIRWIGQINR